IGCSQSPTAPSPTATQTPTASGPIVLNLQWTAAPTCGPVTMPPAQPAFSEAMLTDQTDVGVTASWPYQSPTRSGRLVARFVNVNNMWGLCSWDIADI